MKGEVEVWYKNKLVLKEDNLIVSEAGRLLADIMTVNPTLSGINSASSTLDASNYTIQAISFGTGKDAFSTNAHYYNATIGTRINTAVSSGLSDGLPIVNFSSITGSAYTPEAGLPEEPNPEATRLEMRDTSIPFSIGAISVSSVFPGNGQLVNFMPSAISQVVNQGTALSSVAAGRVLGTIMGCFPSKNTVSAIAIFPDGQELSALVGSSTFNTVSSMDYSGFVTRTATGVVNPASGLVKSGNQPYSTGVIYSVELGPGDLQCANLYGGIYHLGLWTVDLPESLRNGNTPPFAFDVLNNPRKYRLFAKKSFSIDITRNEDNGTFAGFTNYDLSENLRIIWRIKFY